MKKLLLIFLLPICLKSQNDVYLHYFAGLTLGLAGGEIAYEIKDNTYLSLGTAIGLSAMVGEGKELYDREVKKTYFSNTDLFFTCWGGLNAAVIFRIRIDLARKNTAIKFIDTDLYY